MMASEYNSNTGLKRSQKHSCKMAQQTKLKVDLFQKYVTDSQDKMKGNEFCDGTLVSKDGEQLKAHKMIMASASTFFSEVLKNYMHAHPLIFMRGVKGNVLRSLIDFIYCEETNLDFMKLIAEVILNPAQKDKTTDNKFSEAWYPKTEQNINRTKYFQILE